MKRILFFRLVLVLAVSSCTVYHPQLASVPLMTHKGETHLSATLQGDLFAMPQIDLDAAYALTNHIAVQGYFGFSNTDIWNGQLAAGYYLPMNHHMVIEAYLGAGRGLSQYQNTDTGGYYRVDYMPLYGQLNFGWANLGRAHIDIGSSLKVGNFHFTGFDDYQGNNKQLGGDYLLLEPQAFFRVGGERVKYQLQVGYNWFVDPKIQEGESLQFNFIPLSVGMGVTFHL